MGNPPQERRTGFQQSVKTAVAAYWPAMVAGLLFIVIQWPVLLNWWEVWSEKEGYYSHGFLVPFIAGFMLWINRNALARAEIRPSWLGLVLLLIFLPTHALGLLLGLRAVYGVAFFLCIFGAMLMLFGWRITKIASVPILFLITAIPIASWMLDNATAGFSLISATVATKFLQLTSGHDITQFGNSIYSPALPGQHTLLVGTPCSGLRLLISLLTFSWFFVYVTNGALWKKVVLMSMALPLSIFINSFRITMIGYVGFWTDSTDAMHTFHDYSGYIGLVICFAILFGVAKLMKAGEVRTGEPAVEQDAEMKPRQKPLGGKAQRTVVFVLFAAAAVFSSTVRPLYDLPKGHLNRAGVPMTIGQWTGQNLSIDDSTTTTLGQGDLMSRVYVDPQSNRQIQVFMDASLDISAFHDPHRCLPGGGAPIASDKVITITFKKPRPFTIKATVLETTGDYGNTLVIYSYLLGHNSFAGTVDMQYANRWNKLSDTKRVITAPWDTNQLRKDILSRQFVWYRFSTEAYGDGNDQKYLIGFIRQFAAQVEGFGE